MTAYPGDSWDIDPSYICEETISDDLGNEATIKVIHIRAEFDVDEKNKATLVTFDGNGGVTNDAASQESVTESMPVNESFTMMGHTETGADAFVREGYTLVGWSFSQTTTADQFHAAIEANTSGGVVNYDTLAHLGFFELDQTVAADNQWLTDDNNWDPLENTVYAIWDLHRFDVTIKMVVEGGDDQSKQFSFTTTGLERLTDNTSFTMTDGGRTTIENIPYGTAFTLSETPCAGFAVKSVTVTQTSDADGVPLEEEPASRVMRSTVQRTR